MSHGEKRAVPDDHPVLEAIRRAPVVPGEPSAEERAAMSAGAVGPFVPHEEVMAEVLRRAESEGHAIPEDDPLWQAVRRAPVCRGPVPEQERRDVDAAIASGRFTDGASVTRELERRREPDPAAIARVEASFAAAPPEWREFFEELDRRDPKMQAGPTDGGQSATRKL